MKLRISFCDERIRDNSGKIEEISINNPRSNNSNKIIGSLKHEIKVNNVLKITIARKINGIINSGETCSICPYRRRI